MTDQHLDQTHSWREVRVFISSTFRDMHAERDYLVKAIFPRLRERLLAYRIHLVDIDLRWGVTKEQVDNDDVLDLCLDEIDRCRPFFIGLLGERYGWVPASYPVKGESKLGWVQAHLGKSVTELEILYGVLDNPAMRGNAFFYFRDPACLDAIPEPLRSDIYVETEQAQQDALQALKARIRQSDFPIMEPYSAQWVDSRLVNLDDFGEAVLNQLWLAIQTEYTLPDTPPTYAHDALAEERDLHQRFAELRRRVYVPRPALHGELLRYLDEPSTKPLVVLGAAGSGKSAMLSWLCDAVGERFNLLLPHFVGASSASTDIRRCLLRWCGELKALCVLNDDIPSDYGDLVTIFREWLAQVPADQSVLLVIDALNQLDETNNPQLLAWLPRELPPHVKIIVSALDDPERNRELVCNLMLRTERVVTVGAMTDSERFEVLHAVPSVSAKTLSADQVRLFMQNPETSNPLYLLVALEELRGSARFETIDVQIADLPQGGDAVTTLFERVVARLEGDFDPTTVQTVLCGLACARAGLPEPDLEELAGGTDIYPVLRQLWSYLQPRGDKVDFFHRQLFKAVRQRYLLGEAAAVSWHQRLADHLESKGWTDRLALEELVWQLLHAGDWEGVELTMTTFGYLDAKHRAGMLFELACDLREAWQTLPADRPWTQNLRLLDQALRRHLHFIDRHRADYPQALLQCLWNEAWWYDTPTAVAHYDSPDGGWGAFVPPWERPEPKLCTLLERWRAEVETRAPELVWLSAQRPPAFPLGGAEMACLRGHASAVTSVFSPDGSRIVAACGFADSESFSVREWDVQQGTALACFRGHESTVSDVTYTPDGARIVSSSWDGTVRTWDAWNTAPLPRLHGHWDWLNCTTFSPDGQRVAAGFGSGGRTGGKVLAWELASWAELPCEQEPVSIVGSVAFSADGRRLAAGSYGEGIRIWDLPAGRALTSLKGNPPMALSPDGTRVIVGRDNLDDAKDDCTVGVWDIETGNRLMCLRGHTSTVTAVTFSPDGTRIASGSSDRTVRIWDAACGVELFCLRWHVKWVNGVAFSPDGTRIAAVSSDKKAQVWDAVNGMLLETHEGLDDHVAVAGGVTSYPWHVSFQTRESVVSDVATGTVIAWTPLKLGYLATHPSGRIWAGAEYARSYLAVLRLEGVPDGITPPAPKSTAVYESILRRGLDAQLSAHDESGSYGHLRALCALLEREGRVEEAAKLRMRFLSTK